MHRILFHLGSLEIHTYGAMVALGFILGIAVAGKLAQRAGINPERVSDLGLWLVAGGMLGGKVFHMIFYWSDFIAAWRANGLASLREGFVFFGGFIFASIAGYIYARRKQLPIAKLADAIAPGLALGHAFGRLGCFFEGCCYGSACSMPWAVYFPAGHPMHNIPVHPTELYEAAGNLLIFAGLLMAYRRKKTDGNIWWLYMIAYGVLRFIVEFFRGDYDVHYFGHFTSAQLIAIPLIAVALIMLLRQRRAARA